MLPTAAPSRPTLSVPSAQAAARRPGSSRVLTRSALPGPVRASAGMPKAEAAVFVVLVPLLSVPVLLATMGAAWAAGVALTLTAVVAWVCAARRVVIGTGWLADRRLWHYRVTTGDQLRAVSLVDTAHGGVLHLSPHTGRSHRLRRSEFDRPDARVALGTVLASGSPTVGAGVRRALAVAPAA